MHTPYSLTLYAGTLPMGEAGPYKVRPGKDSCKNASNAPKIARYVHASSEGIGHKLATPAMPFSLAYFTNSTTDALN